MEVFPKIAKTIYITLIGAVIFLFFLDFGKVHITQATNYYIARNTANYVAKFSVKGDQLIDYTQTTVEKEAVKDALEQYYDLQFTNMMYSGGRVSLADPNKFKAVYIPIGENRNDYRYRAPIFVRAILTGFDGSSEGLVEINIEQKVPAGVRSILEANRVPISTVENPTDGIDFEGFWGYYSIISEHSFSVNIVK